MPWILADRVFLSPAIGSSPLAPHRRRQSTLIYSTTVDPSSSPSSSSPASPGLSLRPPPSTPAANSTFGHWAGSGSAASTPNLGDLSRVAGLYHDSAAISPPLVPSSSAPYSPQAQGSGVGSGASMESIHTAESFQQRRKRSESTGGFKSNISRMVRKSSSNFLKKLVKSFDDRDAPPIPNLADHLTSPLASPCDESHPARGKPQLPDLEPQLPGHLIAPPPLSPLFGQEVARYSASEPTSAIDIGVSAAYPNAGSNVESWLQQSAESSGIRPPGAAMCSDHGDDDYEEEIDEEEDEDVPAVITNRLSKLYESGSMHLSNQSQTSLYYSTKSTFSENEGTESIAASSPKRASFIVQEALGYSLGLSRGNSGRLSQYSIGSSNGGYATLPHLRSSSSSMPSSPGLGKTFFEPAEGRSSISRRPVSMFTPTRSSLAIEDSRQDEEDLGGSKCEEEVNAPSTALIVSTDEGAELITEPTEMPAVTPRRPSPTQRTAPNAVESGSGGLGVPAVRPITICVSAEELNRFSGHPGASSNGLHGEDAREPSETLALRTARQCYDEDETFLRRDEISVYLGTPKAFNQLVLTHYMNYFDFSGMRLDVAFRTLCQRLALKGETQEVDRILVVFAQRYVDCNPHSLLGGSTNSKDVVHAITYSILLLNTDLHVVQQSTRMSKSAFVKNTLQVVEDQISQPTFIDPNPPQLDRPSFLGDESSWLSSPSGFNFPGADDMSINSTATTPTTATPKKRTPSVRSWKSSHSHQPGLFNSSRITPDSKTGNRYGKAWLQELEVMLKDIYSAVKHNQILLPTSAGATGSNAISSPPMSPTTNTGFGSSFFSSNRISRLIQPSSFSNATASSSASQHHVYESGSGSGSGLLSGGGFGMGLSGRRNSLSARSKQRRNEAIQRLNAQQQQLNTPGANQHESSALLSISPMSSHFPNPRYSIAGSILNEASVIDMANSPGFQPEGERFGGGNSSTTRLTSGNAGGGYLGSAGRLSSLTLATTTTMTTPSASQNSLTSLQSPASSIISEEYHHQYRKKSGSSRPTPPSSLLTPYVTMPPLHSDPQIQQIQIQRYQFHYQQRYRLEGILWRKHLLERHDKKAQNRAWRHLLVVVDQERGSLAMFRADQSMNQSKGLGHGYGSSQHLPVPPSSASTLSLASALSPTLESYPMTHASSYSDQGAPLFDEIPLQHTITNILPAPGYSASRKHVFAVQLFTGAVYLFQTSTPQECEVWARTCNFWAARTSKEPLMGGVVNMEYGWGRALETLHQFEQEQEQIQQLQQQQLLEMSLDTMAPSSKSSQSSGYSIQGPRGRSQTAGANASQSNHSSGSVPPLPIGTGPFHGSSFSHNMSQDNISVLSGRGGPVSSGKSASVRSSARAASFSGAASMTGGGSSPLPSPSVSSSSISTASTFLASSAIGGTVAGSGALATTAALGEQVTLFEWTAPNPAMTLSQLTVEDQLQALKKYVASLECEMETHQGHRGPMMRLFHSKSSNHTKAFNNWERRSGHMLKEMVKYQIYVECLGQDLQFWQELQSELEHELGIQLEDEATLGSQETTEGLVDSNSENKEALITSGCDGSEKRLELTVTKEPRIDLEAELADLIVRDEPALLLMRER